MSRLFRVRLLLTVTCLNFVFITPISAAGFADVPNNHQEKQAVNYVADHGWMTGSEDGLFHPALPLTRCELAKIVFTISGFDSSHTDTSFQEFSDVALNHWCNKILVTLRSQNIIHGYPDHTFRPNQPVSQIEALKMILNAFHIERSLTTQDLYTDVHIDDWWAPYVEFAMNSQLLPRRYGTYGINKPMQRQEVAHILWKQLTAGNGNIHNIGDSRYGVVINSLSFFQGNEVEVIVSYCQGTVVTLETENILLQNKQVCKGINSLVLITLGDTPQLLTQIDTQKLDNYPVLLRLSTTKNEMGKAFVLITYSLHPCEITGHYCDIDETESFDNRPTAVLSLNNSHSSYTYREFVNYPDTSAGFIKSTEGTDIVWNFDSDQGASDQIKGIFIARTCDNSSCSMQTLKGYNLTSDTITSVTTEQAAQAKTNLDLRPRNGNGDPLPFWSDLKWLGENHWSATINDPTSGNRIINITY